MPVSHKTKRKNGRRKYHNSSSSSSRTDRLVNQRWKDLGKGISILRECHDLGNVARM
jgi:hypothetical protein